MQIKNHTEKIFIDDYLLMIYWYLLMTTINKKYLFIDDYKILFPYVNWQCRQYHGICTFQQGWDEEIGYKSDGESYNFFFASFCQYIQGNDSKYSNCICEDIHNDIINNSEKLKSRCPQKGDGYYVTGQWNSVIISNDAYENCNTWQEDWCIF